MLDISIALCEDSYINKETTMTASQVRKVQEAIRECDRYIAKEGSRSEDLRPVEIQKLLAWYIAHRAKLLSLLNA